jgi:hypothetical protein
MRKIKRGFIHCSATQPDWMDGRPLDDKVSEIRRWHMDRGWRDIGYHWIIDRDGSIASGRKEQDRPAHAKGHNHDTVAVCLIGGHGSSETDAFEDNFTPQQEAMLRALILDWETRYDGITIHGHNEVAAKACPGFNVRRWYAAKRPRTSAAQSTTLQATAAGVGGTVAAASGVFSAVGQLDATAQVAIVAGVSVAVLAFAWIARERLRKWAAGDR